jgi:hypothetical protein
MDKWRKSSHSGAQLSCVEVAPTWAVRDSKAPANGQLNFAKRHWSMFVNSIKQA